MRFRVDSAQDGFANMADDCEMLALAEAGTASARLYQWSGIWVSLARFQTAEEALIDPATPWVARPTGGKAVVHGHDLTLAIAMPVDPSRTRKLKGIYHELTQPLVAALNGCGLSAGLGQEVGAFTQCASQDCFADRSAYDVVSLATGDKVCGCALRVTRRGALLQASIPFRASTINPASVIRGGEVGAVLGWRHEDFAGALESALGER